MKIRDLVRDLSYKEIKERKWRIPRLWKNGKKLLFSDYIISYDGIILRAVESVVGTLPGKLIKSGPYSRGYFDTGLRLNRVRYSRIKLHRLVWESWKGKIPKGLEINHKDGNKGNNNFDNLEVMTHKENIEHAIKNGLHSTEEIRRKMSGEKSPAAKLTEKKIRKIRFLTYIKNWKQKKVAEKFKVTGPCVHGIIYGKSWNPKKLTRKELREKYGN